MNFAIIEHNAVANTAVAESALHPNWVLMPEGVGIGWGYSGGVFTAPVIPVPSRKDVILARLAEIDATTDKPRTRRELALARAATKAWLQVLDNEADVLRTELAGLP
jgi:hypothetical protein